MEKKIIVLPFVFVLCFILFFPVNLIHSQEERKALTFQNIIEEIRCGTKPAPIDEIAQILIGNFGNKPQDYRCIIPGYMLYDAYSQIINTINKTVLSIDQLLVTGS